MKLTKLILTIIFAIFMIYGGVNHFLKPDMYLPFIPIELIVLHKLYGPENSGGQPNRFYMFFNHTLGFKVRHTRVHVRPTH